jgi:MOSC domain-containing protein YiiM
MIGRIVAVSVSKTKGVKKTNVPQARLVVGHGLEGDAHAGDWHRQVSLLAQESIDRMQHMGLVLAPGDFAENLTTSGLEVFTLPIGARLRIGPEVELEVTQIGKACHQGCAIREQVGDCVMPREGIFTRVLAGGLVQPGDSIEVVDVSSRHSDH